MDTDRRALLALGVFGTGSRLGERIERLLERGREFSAPVSKARVCGSAALFAGFMIAASLMPRAIGFAQEIAMFEAATVKPSPPDHIGAQIFSPGPGRLTVMTATLKDLVAFANSVKRFQVTGGPGWVDSAHYDISAKAEGAAAFPQLRAMLEPLLADRFRLRIHRETKQQPVYELIVAKGGAKLREAGSAGLGVGGGRGRLNGRGADMATLAWALSEQLDRAVLDRTGLTGFYEFTLTWTPDGAQTNGDPETSLFSGIEDQLGLKLQPAKGAVETLVIDSAEKPDDN